MKRFITIALIVIVFLGAAAITPAVAAPGAHFRVRADAGWVATGIMVNYGDPLAITANARAQTGPMSQYPDAKSDADGQIHICEMFSYPFEPCAMEGAPYGALVGKIGAGGGAFLVGKNFDGYALGTGELYLAVNDNLPYYGDNKGGFSVSVGP